jgi:hypothetical protein
LWSKERTTCKEATEANLEKMEPDPGMMQSVGEHQEVPKEEAEVRSSGALRSGTGAGIWPQGAARSRRRGPGEIMDPGRDSPSQAER